MSAASILNQGDRVSLVADGGWYAVWDGWKLDSIGSKIIDYPNARFAWARRGSSNIAELLMCRFRKARSLDDALQMAVPALDLAVRVCRSRWPDAPAFVSNSEVKIIGWSDERQAVEGWKLSTRDMMLHPVPFIAAAPFPCARDDDLWEIVAEGQDLPDVEAWNALDTRSAAGALIDAQRIHYVTDDDTPGAYIVGGFAEMVTVTREGMTRETIRQWADPIGQPINPFRR